MEGEALFKQIISGKKSGPLGALARGSLLLLSKLYAYGVNKRNTVYDKGQKVSRVNAPVISVGNITAGGTGKTPMVAYLCRELERRGFHPAVVSRGYKAADNKQSMVVAHNGEYRVTPSISGDEAWLLARGLQQGSVLIGRSRVTSAELAIRELHSDVIVMDDGFQHRALHRDVDIVLIDAANPFGYDHVLPRGLLREPLTGLTRASLLILTKTNQVSPSTLEVLRKRLQELAPTIPLAETVHSPVGVSELEAWAKGEALVPLQSYTDKKVWAVSGIGQPESFVSTLQEAGYDVIGMKAFGDHHDYSRDDVFQAVAEAKAAGAEAIAVTEKDAVKLAAVLSGCKTELPIIVLAIGIQFTSNEKAVQEVLDNIKGADD